MAFWHFRNKKLYILTISWQCWHLFLQEGINCLENGLGRFIKVSPKTHKIKRFRKNKRNKCDFFLLSTLGLHSRPCLKLILPCLETCSVFQLKFFAPWVFPEKVSFFPFELDRHLKGISLSCNIRIFTISNALKFKMIFRDVSPKRV